MPSQYHNVIQNAIVIFGTNHSKVQRVREMGHPIHINHPTKNKSIAYRPDVHFKLRNNRIIIFEILDTQSDEKTIADITRSILSPNATQVYFIVKTKERRTEIAKICDIIVSKLADEFEIEKGKMLRDGVSTIDISEEDVEDVEALQNLLHKEITI